MNRIIVICIALGVVLSVPDVSLADRRSEQITSRDAIRIARQELERRKVSLPKDYDLKVMEGNAYFEFEKPRKIYVVSIHFTDRRKRRVNCTIHVDRQSGKVDAFSDSRKLKRLQL